MLGWLGRRRGSECSLFLLSLTCSPWAESVPTRPWICFSVTVLPDALLSPCTAPRAAGSRVEVKDNLQRKLPSVLFPWTQAGICTQVLSYCVAAGLFLSTFPWHQAVPPSWTAVLMPVDGGCSASACAIQLCCGGWVVPSRQHFSQQSPWTGEIRHSSPQCHLTLAQLCLSGIF